MSKYKWSHPGEWLQDAINEADTIEELRDLAHALAGVLDGDQIQDLFQAGMTGDGYFDEQESV